MIAGEDIDVILITEVIPKAQTLPITPARLSLPDYNLYTNFDPNQPNLGSKELRGIAIYTSDRINASEAGIMKCSQIEQRWIELRLKGNDQLYIYRLYLQKPIF